MHVPKLASVMKSFFKKFVWILLSTSSLQSKVAFSRTMTWSTGQHFWCGFENADETETMKCVRIEKVAVDIFMAERDQLNRLRTNTGFGRR